MDMDAPVGGLAEWSNAPVLKTDEGESPPRVRIPEPPPFPAFYLCLYCTMVLCLVVPAGTWAVFLSIFFGFAKRFLASARLAPILQV